MRSLGRVISGLGFLHVCVAQNKCYYPNGVQSDSDFPCDPNAEQSACCGGSFGSVCLTNKLCRGPDGNIIRGSCTDQDWNAPECAQYCLGATTGGTDLISCANVTGTDTLYCCDPGRPFCCDDGVSRFEVLPSKPQVLAHWDKSASQFVVVLKTTSSSFLSSSTTLTTTTTKTTAGAQETSEAPGQSTTQTEDATSGSSSSLPVAAKAGIGAGVAVLVILLATIAFLVWKLRRRSEQEKGAAAQPGGETWLAYEPQNGDGGGAGLGVVAEMPGKPAQEMEGWYPDNPTYRYASGELPGAGNEAVRVELPVAPRGRAH